MNNKSNKFIKNLIILSPNYWHTPLKFRRHRFAELAARHGYRVAFINPTFTILSFLMDRESRSCFFSFFKGGQQVRPGLTVYTMPPLLPFQAKIWGIRRLNLALSRILLRMIVKRHFAGEYVVQIAYLPEDCHHVLGNNATVVYECVDEHSAYPWNARHKSRIEEAERKLMVRADLVSFTSQFLMDKKSRHNPNCVFTPNGVDFDLFSSATSENTLVPGEIAHLGSPIIMYTGAIMEWFDTALVDQFAKQHPDWNIVLIGPLRGTDSTFLNNANVHHLGVRQQSSLPGYLKKADVCIIPFVVNDLIKGVNPLKLYEYLAAGKPVVCSPLPDVLPFEQENVVHIGRDSREFISQIEHLVQKGKEPDWVAERQKVAKSCSWDAIYNKLFNRIEKDEPRSAACHS